MRKRILVIDDEQHIRRMIRLTLEAVGYEVGEASDGLEGLKLYEDGSDWSAVVLDQRMPGIDGLETLRQIKQKDPSARVIMATAYASIELAVDSMKFGATDFVRKPMTPETLRNAVAAAVAKAPVERVGRITPTPEKSAPIAFPTITMNGFTILDQEKGDNSSTERHFTVVEPGGSRHEVTVRIDEEAVRYVQRMTRKVLPLESSFWTDQARRVLGDFLWSKAKIPGTEELAVKDISREELLVAERWTGK